MDLSSEEQIKLNNLRNTAQFQHSWKAIRNIITWKERVQHYFARNMVLLFLCFIVGGGLMLLADEGTLSHSILLDKLLTLLTRLGIFLVVLQILSVLFYSLIGPGWEAKQKTKLRTLYEREILAPILQVLYPSAQIDTEHDMSPNHVKEVVPSAEYYIQSGILELNDERNLQIVDLYAYSITKGKDSQDVTHFLGQVYSIKNTLPLRGELRIVPTQHFLNIETQGGYLGSRCKLSFYSNESRIYFANYNNRYFFAAPKDKESLRTWRIEETAIQLKHVFYFANEVTEMLYKNEGFS